MPTKKQASKSAGARSSSWKMSWKSLLLAASVVANIAFVVVFATMITSNKLDKLLIQEGLSRYCLSENDYLYEDATAEAKAHRDFHCAKGEAKPYYQEAIESYMKDYKKN